MAKTIEVDVAPDGEVKIEAFGFEGGACLAATKEIEDALGKTGNRKMKEGAGFAPAPKLKQ